MKKLFTLAAIVLFMLAIVTPLAIAGCSTGHASAKEGAESETQEGVLATGEVVNNICPIMGGEVGKDAPYKVEYDGKAIGFCCQACVDKFNEDPEKYAQKLDELETNIEE
ncbi:YHS domain-containing protein [Candidatus Omnitrophota bacterium]